MVMGTAKVFRKRGERLAQGARWAIVGVTAIALSGCTSLSVIPDRVVSAGSKTALSGMTYALPMLQYEVEATRLLASCPEPVKIEGDASGQEVWSGRIAVELDAKATPSQIAGERYAIDYSKLDGWLKTTNFAIEYQPGTDILKGINVSVADQSGELVGGVVKTGLTVAAVASGPAGAGAVIAAKAGGSALGLKNNPQGTTEWVESAKLFGVRPLPAWGADFERISRKDLEDAVTKRQNELRSGLVALMQNAASDKTILGCMPSVLADVKARGEKAKALKDKVEELKVANEALARYTKIAEVRGLDSTSRKTLGDTLTNVLGLEAEVAKLKDEIATIEKRLGATGKEVWPTRFDMTEDLDLAPIGENATKRLAGHLRVMTVRLVDDQKLANDLANAADLAAYRGIAKDLVDRYVDSDGKAKQFPDVVAPDPCAKAANLDPQTCVAALGKLAAKLEPVKTDFLPDCPNPKPDSQPSPSAECLTRLGEDVNGKKEDFPRQVPGRGIAPQPGLFVRPPVRAELTICQASFSIAGTFACNAKAEDLIKDDKVQAPQLGQLRFLQLENEMFSNDAMSLSLSKDGAIEKFQYGSSRTIAKSLLDAASQGAEFYKTRREQYLANTDETKVLQDQIALAEAQKKLDGLRAVPSSDPDPAKLIATAKAEAEVELLRAQINALKAQTAALIATGS